VPYDQTEDLFSEQFAVDMPLRHHTATDQTYEEVLMHVVMI
jgi:hypothetical protein